MGLLEDLKIKYKTHKTTLETVPGTKQASNHQSYSKSTVLPGTGHIRGGSWELILIAGVVWLCTKNILWRGHGSGKGLVQGTGWSSAVWRASRVWPNHVRLGRESLAAVRGLGLSVKWKWFSRCTKKMKGREGPPLVIFGFHLFKVKRGWEQQGSLVTWSVGLQHLLPREVNLSCSLFPTPPGEEPEKDKSNLNSHSPTFGERRNPSLFSNSLHKNNFSLHQKQTGTQLGNAAGLSQSKVPEGKSCSCCSLKGDRWQQREITFGIRSGGRDRPPWINKAFPQRALGERPSKQAVHTPPWKLSKGHDC